YPMYLRDLLLRAAEADLYYVHWSQEILDGAIQNLVADQRITPKQALVLEEQIKIAFPEAMIKVTDRLIPCMDNHPGDRHVLATALIAKAHIIVTDNLKHFSKESLSQFRIKAQSADQFLTNLYDLYPERMIKTIEDMVESLKKPPLSRQELLDLFKKSVPTFVSRFQ
ncbi:MAG: PIN domain-containing protein, partial [Waterburya sp.]